MRPGRTAVLVLMLMVFAALHPFAIGALTAEAAPPAGSASDNTNGLINYSAPPLLADFTRGKDVLEAFSRWTLSPIAYAMKFPLRSLALAALMLGGSLVCGRLMTDTRKPHHGNKSAEKSPEGPPEKQGHA